MNKKIIAAVLAVSATAASFGSAVMADDDIKVFVNGSQVEFDTAPFIENDRTLVPMRAIFEALGVYVEWDGETKTIISYDPSSDTSITMQIDSNKMFVGEKAVELDVSAKLVDDRTVVPLRAISEGLNSTVDWNGDTRTVTVTKTVSTDMTITSNTSPVSDGTQTANPWTDYETLEDLNAAIQENGDIKFAVADLSVSGLTVSSYRYMPQNNIAEITYDYSENDITSEITVRTSSGDYDVSGVNGASKTEDTMVGSDAAEIYKTSDTAYISWAHEDSDSIISHSVAITINDMSDDTAANLLKTFADAVESSYPRG